MGYYEQIMEQEEKKMAETKKGNIAWRIVKTNNPTVIELISDWRYKSERQAELYAKTLHFNEEYVIIPVYSYYVTDVWARTKKSNIKTSHGKTWRIPDNERLTKENFENQGLTIAKLRKENSQFRETSQKLHKKIKNTNIYIYLLGVFWVLMMAYEIWTMI